MLILPIENAKGLEFDSVIIADANSDYYKDDLLSIKLLYVAITRALHRLCVITKEGDNFSKNLMFKCFNCKKKLKRMDISEQRTEITALFVFFHNI